MLRLILRLLGPPRLEREGVPLEFQYRKNVALLAYLAVTSERHSREMLLTLLWPELDPSRARGGTCARARAGYVGDGGTAGGRAGGIEASCDDGLYGKMRWHD